MQIEYPFLRYNIFSYVYVLSFYDRAKTDSRFLEAFDVLQTKLDTEGNMIVERPNRNLRAFTKGQQSEPATKRYEEILSNIKN